MSQLLEPRRTARQWIIGILMWGAILAVLYFLFGCTTPAGRAAKRDATAIQADAHAADAAVASAQAANRQLDADNAQMARDNAALSRNDADIRTDAQRIEDKAVILGTP